MLCRLAMVLECTRDYRRIRSAGCGVFAARCEREWVPAVRIGYGPR